MAAAMQGGWISTQARRRGEHGLVGGEPQRLQGPHLRWCLHSCILVQC